MSLVPTFVQSTSGKWYKNPVIKGDDWFICWDDDEPIELVVKATPSRKDAVETIVQDLNLRGWNVRRKTKVRSDGSRFFDGKLFPACQCFLIQEAGPTDDILKDTEPEKHKPKADCVLYFNGKDGHPS